MEPLVGWAAFRRQWRASLDYLQTRPRVIRSPLSATHYLENRAAHAFPLSRIRRRVHAVPHAGVHVALVERIRARNGALDEPVGNVRAGRRCAHLIEMPRLDWRPSRFSANLGKRKRPEDGIADV